MSADRELLELAAKAAEIGPLDFDYAEREGHGLYFGPRLPMPTGVMMAAMHRYWNPLTDDGDALRLAARLRLTVSWDRFDGSDYATATPPHTHQGYDCIADQDPCAATRRAITRAAAGIGRAMP